RHKVHPVLREPARVPELLLRAVADPRAERFRVARAAMALHRRRVQRRKLQRHLFLLSARRPVAVAAGPRYPAAVRPLLYQFWASSASWRVRWALAVKGVAVDVVSVDLRADEQLSPEHRARNPIGHVPALCVDGRCLAESV